MVLVTQLLRYQSLAVRRYPPYPSLHGLLLFSRNLSNHCRAHAPHRQSHRQQDKVDRSANAF
jgi:hypothetical protein